MKHRKEKCLDMEKKMFVPFNERCIFNATYTWKQSTILNFLFPFVCVKSGRPTGVKYGWRHETIVVSLYKHGSRSFMFLC